MDVLISKWVAEYGDILFKYAISRVGTRAEAEDLVQDTFLAALKSSNFAERSAPQTWLIGILRHKIMDHYRQLYREKSKSGETRLAELTGEGETFESMFTEKGMWKEPVAKWGFTEQALLDAEFNRIVNACLEHLPVQQKTAFVFRTLEEKSTEEICNDFAVSTTHLGVLLFRARTQLRKCLEINWFSGRVA